MKIRIPVYLLLLTDFLYAAEPPSLRLPDSFRTNRYTAELTLLPGADSFSGKIEIDVTLAKPASSIWLNATELSIAEAFAEAGGSVRPTVVEPGGDDFVALNFPAPLHAGPARLKIKYGGKIAAKSNEGIFQGIDSGDNYLLTQFATIHARRAFP